jgi:hypothetical protein
MVVRYSLMEHSQSRSDILVLRGIWVARIGNSLMNHGEEPQKAGGLVTHLV